MDIQGSERTYRAPATEEVEAAASARAALLDLPETEDGLSPVPDEAMVMSQYRRYVNIVYGIDTWRGLFNDRQLLVLGTLARLVREAHACDGVRRNGRRPSPSRGYLPGLCGRTRSPTTTRRSARWAPKGEFLRDTFPQQSIRMAWDFTEVDPFAGVSGSWNGAVGVDRPRSRPPLRRSDSLQPTVQRGNAQALDFPDGHFDAVIVDPPYYDAFQYGDLSDFFYVWLKRSVGHLYPELFVTPLTPKQAEIIENRADKKSAEYISHDEFERRLERALAETGAGRQG